MTAPTPARSVHTLLVAVGAALALLLTAVPAQAATTPASPSASPATTGAPRSSDPVAHDPTMVKEGGWYYVAITGDAAKAGTYLPMKRSRDLVHWQEIGPVFTALPSWIPSALGVPAADAPKDLWAPDLSRSHGEWRLYYAVSRFGENTSVIGLATTPVLDPSDPRFGWRDRGLILHSKDYRSEGGDSFNAIDPGITTDASGATWLSFGSFFSGIYLHRIDAATGRIRPGDDAVHIAERAAPDAEENAAIVRHGGWYYLFLSFDNCCRALESDYRTFVARSRSITGPYLDRAGQPMLGAGGTELMRGHDELVGAGGADVLLGAGDRDWVVNHYYDGSDEGTPRLSVRRLAWDARGWPRVSEPLHPSRSIGRGDAYVTVRSAAARGLVIEDRRCGYEGAPAVAARGTGTTCQQWQVSDRGSGSRITNRFSNQVLENASCRNVDGGPVAQFPWLGHQESNDCQRWTFAAAGGGWTSVSTVQAGGRAWTLPASRAGTPVVIDQPTGGAAQRFAFQPVGRVLLASTTSAVRTLGARGDRVAFQTRSARGDQEWRFTAVGGARYRVTTADTGRRLVATATGLRVVGTRTRDSATTTWTLLPQDDGGWLLSNTAAQQRVRLLLP